MRDVRSHSRIRAWFLTQAQKTVKKQNEGWISKMQCGNRIEGNMFLGFKYGLELWDKSDGNSIRGNKIIDCGSSILINTSKGNKVIGNTLASNGSAALFAYNDGDNDWSLNYYSDWKKAGPRSLSGIGSDKSPLLAEPTLKKAKTEIQPKLSYYASRWDESKNNIGRGLITHYQPMEGQDCQLYMA